MVNHPHRRRKAAKAAAPDVSSAAPTLEPVVAVLSEAIELRMAAKWHPTSIARFVLDFTNHTALLDVAKLMVKFLDDAPTLDYGEDATLSWITIVSAKARTAIAKAEHRYRQSRASPMKRMVVRIAVDVEDEDAPITPLHAVQVCRAYAADELSDISLPIWMAYQDAARMIRDAVLQINGLSFRLPSEGSKCKRK